MNKKYYLILFLTIIFTIFKTDKTYCFTKQVKIINKSDSVVNIEITKKTIFGKSYKMGARKILKLERNEKIHLTIRGQRVQIKINDKTYDLYEICEKTMGPQNCLFGFVIITPIYTQFVAWGWLRNE